MVRLIALFLGLLCFVNLPLFAQNPDVQKFQISITDKLKKEFDDTKGLSRQDYFVSQVKLSLVSNAVWNIIGNELYDKYRSQIYRRILIFAEEYLLSLEFSKVEDKEYAIGSVRISELSEALLLNSIPLKDMPLIKTALIYHGINKSMGNGLMSQLSLFNIRVGQSFPLQSFEQSNSPANFNPKAFFEQRRDFDIAYLIHGENVGEKEMILFNVYERGRQKPLAQLRFDSQDFEKSKERQSTPSNFQDFVLENINPVSLKTEFYGQLGDDFKLVVKGAFSPETITAFENNILRKNPRLQEYKLEKLNSFSVVYSLELKTEQRNSFINSMRNNPALLVELGEMNESSATIERLQLKARSANYAEAGRMTEQEAQVFRNAGHSVGSADTVLLEKENNNTVDLANRVDIEKFAKGQIKDRLDQDIYLFEIDPTAVNLKFNLLLNKNSLYNLKITIYDQNLKQIFRHYALKNEFQTFYVNLRASGSRNIYVRLEERSGYIPVETGRRIPLDYILSIKS